MTELTDEDYGAALAFIQEQDFWGKWLKSSRKGDTGIGKVLETCLDIVENNFQGPDVPVKEHRGVEVKSHRHDSNALITLFNANPCEPHRAAHDLVDRFGYLDEGSKIKKFNTNFARHRLSVIGDNTFTVCSKKDQISILANDQEEVARWDVNKLFDKLERKLSYLAFITAETRRCPVSGSEEFKYNEGKFYWGLRPDLFMKSVDDGDISIQFRIKGTKNSARNRGTAFRIKSNDLSKMYDNVMPIKQITD